MTQDRFRGFRPSGTPLQRMPVRGEVVLKWCYAIGGGVPVVVIGFASPRSHLKKHKGLWVCDRAALSEKPTPTATMLYYKDAHGNEAGCVADAHEIKLLGAQLSLWGAS